MEIPQAARPFYHRYQTLGRHYIPVVHPLPLRFKPLSDPYMSGTGHFLPVSYNLPALDVPEATPKVPKRIRFTAEQLEILEKQFEGNHYPDRVDREYLSQQLCLTEANVRVWFQNRRARFRRQSRRSHPQTNREDFKKRPAPFVMPTLPTSESKCQLNLSSVTPSHIRCPPVPYSPMFSPGASPGFSRMFTFPLLPDLVTSSNHCDTAQAFQEKRIDDVDVCTTYVTDHSSVADIKSMESR